MAGRHDGRVASQDPGEDHFAGQNSPQGDLGQDFLLGTVEDSVVCSTRIQTNIIE
jgi:hypothetical protein